MEPTLRTKIIVDLFQAVCNAEQITTKCEPFHLACEYIFMFIHGMGIGRVIYTYGLRIFTSFKFTFAIEITRAYFGVYANIFLLEKV